MKTRAYILVGLLILASCGHVRIDMISEHSGFKLPEKYKVIKNLTESSGFAGQDFEINVVLEFDKQTLIEISEHIDSLVIENPNWIRNGMIIEYSNQINHNESETIEIDLERGVLTFSFVHI